MKKYILPIFFIFVFLFPLWSHPFYQSHDGENHVARFVSYFQAFQDGQFPPRWAGNLNFGYGTPVLIFFYPLPGFLSSILHLFGLNFETIFKILIGIGFFGGFISFYQWVKLLFKKEVAFVGAVVYGLAPYHLLNLYVRGDIAEMIAFFFVPLVFWGIEKTLSKKTFAYVFLGGLFYGLLILSHNGVSLMFSPLFLLYGIVRSPNKKQFLSIILLFLIGLGLSAFFWIPALYEGRFVNTQLFIGSMYKDHFPTIWQLIYSSWGFGPEVSKPDGLSPQIGILLFIFVLVSCVLWARSKTQKVFWGMWIVVFLAALFIMLPLSNSIWSHLPMLRLYEFPWRFVGIATFAACVLACFAMEKVTNTKALFIIAIIAVLVAIPLITVKKYVSYPDGYYAKFTGTTYYHGEASPIWTAGDPTTFAKSQIELIGGQGTIKQVEKKTNEHSFVVQAKNEISLLDNTLYFPGWKVLIDDVETPIQFQDSNHRGLITFQVPQGQHSVKVLFVESKDRLFADGISLVSWLLLIVYFVKKKFWKR